MANDYEWAHVSDAEQWLVDPETLSDIADDGNPNKDFGLAFSTGSNGCMIFGSLKELDELADKIKTMVQDAKK